MGMMMSEEHGILYFKALLAYLRDHHEKAFAYFEEAANQQLKEAILWKAVMMIEGKGCERNVAAALQLARDHLTTPLDRTMINRYLVLYYQEFDNKANILKVLEESVRYDDQQTMFWLAGLHYYGSEHFDMPQNTYKAAWHWLLWKMSWAHPPYWLSASLAHVVLSVPFAKQWILKFIPKHIIETDPRHVSRQADRDRQALSTNAIGELKKALEELGLSQQEIAGI